MAGKTWQQEGEAHPAVGKVAGHISSHTGSRETRGWDYSMNIKVHLQLYTSSSEAPPPKVPQHSQTAPPAGVQEFTCVNQWG